MRVAQITPSAGDSFYCENCLRDAALVKAMHKLGHDVLMIPLYLPLQIDKSSPIGKMPIFFGGINVYLQQKSALFRRTPRWLDRLFDSPKLLNWVARKARMTSAQDLGETTVSMLQGENGKQIKELNRLAEWLATQDNKPDIVCLSNVLLAGLAGRIKDKLGVPVVCLLQDEDGFLDGLPPRHAAQAWEILRKRASDINAFIAVSKYYADTMQHRLGLQPGSVHVVYTGIFLDGYELCEAVPEAPTIGYLSPMCSEKGLDTLVEAFGLLKKNKRLGTARLRVTGGKRADDNTFLSQIRAQLRSCGLVDDVDFLADFGPDSRFAFLRSISVLSVPEKRPVACGLYALEALAAGVPVVQPASGVFPELLDMTGGGVLCEPNSGPALAAALEPLLLEPDYARKLGNQGRNAVFEKFNIEQTAENMVRIYVEIGAQSV